MWAIKQQQRYFLRLIKMGGIPISLSVFFSSSVEGEGNKANNDNMYSGVLKNLDWTTNVCDINCILIKCLHSAHLNYYIHSCTLIRILSHIVFISPCKGGNILFKLDYDSH